MPELPEVETVKQNLAQFLEKKLIVQDILFHRKDLRSPLPFHRRQQILGEALLEVQRRAKYLLLKTERHYLISHLGMSGFWRVGGEAENHDHVEIHFQNGDRWIYQDPRRFGVFDIITHEALLTDVRFSHLGPEPLEKLFHGKYLFERSRGKKVPLKTFIMDQRVVVGVGNIYAVEALYVAGLSPTKLAGRVSLESYQLLAREIQKTLKKAIRRGGSSIRDFKQVNGQSGHFQNDFLVYGRKGEACRKCGTQIRVKVITGRSTFWCVKCQK